MGEKRERGRREGREGQLVRSRTEGFRGNAVI